MYRVPVDVILLKYNGTQIRFYQDRYVVNYVKRVQQVQRLFHNNYSAYDIVIQTEMEYNFVKRETINNTISSGYI